MTAQHYKYAALGLAGLSLILLAICISLMIEITALKIRLSMAVEQINIFESLRESTEAEDISAEKMADNMAGVIEYYASGTKQISGSRTDRLVEYARQLVIRDIISRLKEKTDADLGQAPGPWIEKYAPKR